MAIREDGTVVFEGAEQLELDRIVGERLSREKAKYSDYDDLKGLDEELKAFGYEGTAKERREAIKAQREAIATQAELEELQEQAKEEGTSPQLLAEIKELKKELAEIKSERLAKKTESENKTKADEAWNKQVTEFQEEYADVDLDKLAENPKFKKFIKGKALPLKELYADFTDFIGETEVEAIVKMKAKEDRSTGSGKGSGNEGGNYGLTPGQQALCKKNGMAYKEYSEILKNIQ